MKVPAETHNGNLNRTQVDAQPGAGTRQMAGKTNDCDSTLKDAKKYTPVAVTTVDRDKNKGACLAAGLRQAEGDGRDKGVVNGNPKKRTANAWGVQKDAKA